MPLIWVCMDLFLFNVQAMLAIIVVSAFVKVAYRRYWTTMNTFLDNHVVIGIRALGSAYPISFYVLKPMFMGKNAHYFKVFKQSFKNKHLPFYFLGWHPNALIIRLIGEPMPLSVIRINMAFAILNCFFILMSVTGFCVLALASIEGFTF